MIIFVVSNENSTELEKQLILKILDKLSHLHQKCRRRNPRDRKRTAPPRSPCSNPLPPSFLVSLQNSANFELQNFEASDRWMSWKSRHFLLNILLYIDIILQKSRPKLWNCEKRNAKNFNEKTKWNLNVQIQISHRLNSTIWETFYREKEGKTGKNKGLFSEMGNQKIDPSVIRAQWKCEEKRREKREKKRGLR